MRCMRRADIPKMDGETSAIWLLEKLYQVRHGAMVLYLTNSKVAGQAFPATADEAYIIGKVGKSFSARVADSRGIIANGAVFLLADKGRALAIVPSLVASNRKPKPAGRDRALEPWRLMIDAEKEIREARQRTGTCNKWGETGHKVRQCPHHALAAIEIEATKRDEFDNNAAQAPIYAAQYALWPPTTPFSPPRK